LGKTVAADETRPKVQAFEVLGDLRVAPLPEGTKAAAAFLLVKLDDGDWCARSIGGDAYNRVEFLGQLSAYTRALLVDEAIGWSEDDDPAT
jgi:hypothetical protein